MMESLQSVIGEYDDFILLGSSRLELFEPVKESVQSFYILERDPAVVAELQKFHRHAFAIQDVDAALDFFSEEIDEMKLQNMFVYVNPFCNLTDAAFYRRLEGLLTGRSFYSFNLHLHLLGQQATESFSGPDRLIHLKEGLQKIDRAGLSKSERHLYHILDEVTR